MMLRTQTLGCSSVLVACATQCTIGLVLMASIMLLVTISVRTGSSLTAGMVGRLLLVV